MEIIAKQRVGRSILWTAKARRPITEADAERLQTAAGYMPMGYDFRGFKTGQYLDASDEQAYTATWICSDSCD